MKINLSNSKNLVTLDNICDRIPIISSITSTVNLIAKGILVNKEVEPEKIADQGRYVKHLKNKSTFRSILLLFPLIGNFLVFLGDLTKKGTATLEESVVKKGFFEPQYAIKIELEKFITDNSEKDIDDLSNEDLKSLYREAVILSAKYQIYKNNLDRDNPFKVMNQEESTEFSTKKIEISGLNRKIADLRYDLLLTGQRYEKKLIDANGHLLKENGDQINDDILARALEILKPKTL